MVASTEPVHQTRSTPEKIVSVSWSQVVQKLEEIQTTPFESSFLSCLQGARESTLPGLIAVDWDTVTPWMSLMNDIRDHYRLAQYDKSSLLIKAGD
jgi:hypothetical protein